MFSVSASQRWSLSGRAYPFIYFFLMGCLIPLGFSPFHCPGLSILGLAGFYHGLLAKPSHPFTSGIWFGLGFFGVGVSWIYVSVHTYGHLHPLVAIVVTLLFLGYLSLFPALAAVLFHILRNQSVRKTGLLFSLCWCLSEYARATWFSGFPWLLIGVGQVDTPLKYVLPFVGVSGVSFLACWVATLVRTAMMEPRYRVRAMLGIVVVMMGPMTLSHYEWSHPVSESLSVGVVQANLSMRDKWNETLFWRLLDTYHHDTKSLLGTDLVVLPESAIPVPASYVSDFLDEMSEAATRAGSAILLGIPATRSEEDTQFFNSVMSLGVAKGHYFKQHLVPFGEYMPKPFQWISRKLGIPLADLIPGQLTQSLINIKGHPVAALICYELAYHELLRRQLPKAEWIVSISDDGWFGHSLAPYQQQQLAAVLAIETARYHVVANNDGLSSVFNPKGDLIAGLPAFDAGILRTHIAASHGTTPWVHMGDKPLLYCFICLLGCYFLRIRYDGLAAWWKRRYPYQPR